MTDKQPVRILVPGKINQRVADRVGAEFDMVRIETADPALITPELAETVRGIAASTKISAAFIDALPKLEIIASFGVGYDAVDAKHAATRGITVTNTPDVLSDEVADTTIGLLLNTLRELPKAERYLRDGRWRKEGAYPLTKLTLRGRTVGIFGLGRIGQAIATRLEGFGVDIAYHSRSQKEAIAYRYAPTLKALAESVDTLIVIVPGGAATEKAVNADILSALGPDGVVINVGRGTTVDTDALIDALSKGTIAAAGLDVIAGEPDVPEAILTMPNACLLPHVASASVHTRDAMADLVVDNLGAWFSTGKALTPVPESRDIARK